VSIKSRNLALSLCPGAAREILVEMAFEVERPEWETETGGRRPRQCRVPWELGGPRHQLPAPDPARVHRAHF
jgi:hypothetical protein